MLPRGPNWHKYLHSKNTINGGHNCNSNHNCYWSYYFSQLRKTCSPSNQGNPKLQVHRMSVFSLTSNSAQLAVYCRLWPWGLKPEDLCFTNACISCNCSHKGHKHSLIVCKAAQFSWGNRWIFKRGTFQTSCAQHFLPASQMESVLDNSLYLSGLEDNQTPAMQLWDLRPFRIFCILVILPPLVC